MAIDEERLEAVLGQLARDGERALQGTAELQQEFETLIEIMLAQGMLKPGHEKLIKKLRERVAVSRKVSVELGLDEDKYTTPNSEIDCAALMHICLGRCCGWQIKLSRQDVREGELEWNIDVPYMMAKGAHGYCVHQERDTGACGVYEKRPSICRSYSCKEDKRVWIDFENKIPQPLLPGLIPSSRLTQGPRSGS